MNQYFTRAKFLSGLMQNRVSSVCEMAEIIDALNERRFETEYESRERDWEVEMLRKRIILLRRELKGQFAELLENIKV